MMRPKPCFFMYGSAAAVPWNTADRFSAMMASHFDREVLDRRGVLDAGVVDQDVDATELAHRVVDQAAHGLALDRSAPSYTTRTPC